MYSNGKVNQNINGKIIRELNYVTSNRFYVEMESQITASFSECQGLGVKIKYERQPEGGVNDQQRILLGQPEFSDVTLKRGVSDDLVFLDWLSKILPGLIDRSLDNRLPRDQAINQESKVLRRNINILVFNQAGETMQCWTLIGAVPVGWKAPSLQANSNTVAIEELTLAYEGMKVYSSGSGQSINVARRKETGYYFY